MSPIVEFFNGLFDTSQWPARWHCGTWTDFHGWLYIISDLTIWASYFMMPVIIFNYVSKRKQAIKFAGIYLLFAAFILLCGTTHLFDAFMFWIPMYRLNALIRFITAIVSAMTVYYLIKILPEIFRQKTNLELELEISRRVTAELKLAEANKNLEAFVSIASHDLQEPLRKIKTFSSILFDNNEQFFTPESTLIARKITQSTDRMQLMVQDVLKLSTITEEIAFDTLQISDIINRVKEDLEFKITEKNAVIHVGEIPAVKGNASYLAQLFMNLISNAIKFNQNQPEISITGIRAGSRIFVDVIDNGIGIDEKDKQRVFEAFSRLNGRSEFEGSGIGLTICRKIAAIHHGSIQVKNNLAGGSCFTVDLPAADEQD